jgi:predicted ATP-dependent protease
MGDVSFGKPSRITARTYVGQQGVVNIEREARLSGNTHDKGVLILGGYLGANFAQEFPLSVAVSIVRRRRWRLRILHRVIRNPVQSFWLAD